MDLHLFLIAFLIEIREWSLIDKCFIDSAVQLRECVGELPEGEGLKVLDSKSSYCNIVWCQVSIWSRSGCDDHMVDYIFFAMNTARILSIVLQ